MLTTYVNTIMGVLNEPYLSTQFISQVPVINIFPEGGNNFEINASVIDCAFFKFMLNWS